MPSLVKRNSYQGDGRGPKERGAEERRSETGSVSKGRAALKRGGGSGLPFVIWLWKEIRVRPQFPRVMCGALFLNGYRRTQYTSIENYNFCWFIAFILSVMPLINNLDN